MSQPTPPELASLLKIEKHLRAIRNYALVIVLILAAQAACSTLPAPADGPGQPVSRPAERPPSRP